MPSLETPTEIPDDAPAEAAPQEDANPYASGDPYRFASQGATRRRVVATVVKAASPAPRVEAKSAGPSRITAGTTPPKTLSSAPAVYPAAAKAAGIEGRVIVRFVVGTDGVPKDVQAVRGPDALRPACVAVVEGSRYSPALRDGQPVEVIKNKVCTFKLST